ncbi:MAG: aquaporin [Acidimicrobiales bacterium]
MKRSQLLAAEAFGTFLLVMGGPGTAVLVPGFEGKAFMVSLAFGLSLLVAAYAIGPVSGCHINPAVTIGLVAAKKLDAALAPTYIVGQLLGGAIGGAAILGIAGGAKGGFTASTANFAVNGWDTLSPGGYGFAAMVLVEVILTAVLIYVVLSTGHAKFSAGMGGLTAGATLALIHMISIPVDNTSVNPARSFAMAVYAGGDALSQLWAFVVFPIIGGVLGAALYRFIND